jgi:peptidoglycan-associated lipoprotein
MIVVVGALAVLAGCSKNLTSSTQDSSLVPGQTASKPEPAVRESEASASRQPSAKEEVRVAEQPEVPAPAPAPQPSQSLEQAPAAAPGSGGLAGELGDVFFDYDKFALRMDASPILDANARLLKAGTGWKLVISGHCDERGTSAYNLVLGERRARTVKKYLEDLGLPSSQMQITSYGKEKPFCTEHNQECWQQNRRAHFTVQ